MSDDKHDKANTLVGLVTLGGGLTGIASLVMAGVALMGADYGAVGLCLLASAMSFGLLANALLRE